MCNCKNKALGRFSFDDATVQTVAANGTIQLPLATSASKCIEANGGNITIREAGTYLVTANATTAAAAAGTEEVQLFRDGNAVPGAHAIETAAAAGDLASMAFSTLVTVDRCGKAILALRSIPATTVRIANLVVEKVS